MGAPPEMPSCSLKDWFQRMPTGGTVYERPSGEPIVVGDEAAPVVIPEEVAPLASALDQDRLIYLQGRIIGLIGAWELMALTNPTLTPETVETLRHCTRELRAVLED